MKRQDSRGFTLVEVMVAVVIIAVLTAIALPSFTSQLRKARRADGVGALMALQLAQEKYRADCPSFATTLATPATSCDGRIAIAGTSPDGYYTLALSGVSSTAYTATATPVAGSSQASDSACSPAISVAVSAGSASYGPANTCWGK